MTTLQKLVTLHHEKVITNGGDISEAYMPPPWLSDSIPRRSPYFPQLGDVLMYFRYVDQI